ncbi:MAG: hypothetical protein GEV13_36380 [Rhodospirillales bacterium]|nr:hypothetical protein [Rhodospirillales bacterium]
MDAKVAARFFRVSERPDATVPEFSDLLLSQMPVTLTARERVLTDGVVLRLEDCKPSGDVIEGEFCRIQTANLPPSAGPQGLAPVELKDGHGLGHMAAFRYHLPTRVLLLQTNSLNASISRISEYVAALNASGVYFMRPVLTQDAWDRFTQKPIRSMQVAFASPANLEGIDKIDLPALAGAKMLAEAYDGVTVEITVSVGKKRKSQLDAEAVKTTLMSILGLGKGLRKARVQTGGDPEDHERGINFLKEHMRIRKELTLPEKDHAGNYEIRRAFLREGMDDKLAHLNELYGPKPNDVFS